uniref:Uncharacterized protein n=1 Tax=Romanomermis culicivorax TaxID=13658 RepID=A0A915HH65_ROMCU
MISGCGQAIGNTLSSAGQGIEHPNACCRFAVDDRSSCRLSFRLFVLPLLSYTAPLPTITTVHYRI